MPGRSSGHQGPHDDFSLPNSRNLVSLALSVPRSFTRPGDNRVFGLGPVDTSSISKNMTNMADNHKQSCLLLDSTGNEKGLLLVLVTRRKRRRSLVETSLTSCAT